LGLAVGGFVFGGMLVFSLVQGEASPAATPGLVFAGYLLYRAAWGQIRRTV
jgi:hypothetical protein